MDFQPGSGFIKRVFREEARVTAVSDPTPVSGRGERSRAGIMIDLPLRHEDISRLQNDGVYKTFVKHREGRSFRRNIITTHQVVVHNLLLFLHKRLQEMKNRLVDPQ